MLPPQRALLVFEAVSRLGSIGAASRELHVTQAAVSQQLKSLEQFLNCTLFIRNQRGVTLTQAAQQYLPVVTGTLQHLKLQTQILFGAQQSDVLRIKANTSIGHHDNLAVKRMLRSPMVLLTVKTPKSNAYAKSNG